MTWREMAGIIVMIAAFEVYAVSRTRSFALRTLLILVAWILVYVRDWAVSK